MKNLGRFLSALVLAVVLGASGAQANTSTINPANPAQGSALSSATLRANFLAAYNDINTIYGLITTIVTNGITSLTGDVTTGTPSSGAAVATLATVNSNVGSFGSATTVPTFTVNGKGLLTAAGSTPIAIGTANLTATGTPSSTTYLRGDNTWATIVGGVTSVFTRTGAVTAQSGDYTVSQVTGAAPLASPTFTGTVNGTAAIWSGVDTALNFTATGTGANAVPVGTTGQAPTAANGLVRYDSTLNRLAVSISSVWQSVFTTSDTIPVINGGAGDTTSGGIAGLPVNRQPLSTDDTTKGYAINNQWTLGKDAWVAIGTSSAYANWQIQSRNSAPLANLISVAPVGAYGVYRLNSNYAGNAFTVTRVSDSTTLNVPFDVTGIANWSLVDAFCLGTTCGVTTLNDQSGNGYDLTATYANSWRIEGGYVGSMRAISVDGINVSTPTLANSSLPITNVQNFTALTVGRRAAQGGSTGTTMFQLGTSSLAFLGWVESLTNGVKWYQSSGHQFSVGNINNDNVMIWNNSAGAITLTQNNLSVSSSGVTSGASTGLQLGYSSLVADPDRYEFLSFVLWNSSLSAANQQTVQKAAERDTGVQPQYAANLILHGDSITYGTGSQTVPAVSNGFAQQLIRSYQGRYNVFVYGDPGELLATMRSDAATIITLAKQTNKNNVVAVFGGTNDLTANDTASNVYGYFQTICGTYRAAGMKCVIATPLARAGTFTNGQTANGFETARQSLITLMQAGWPSFADGIINTGSDPVMGLQANASNSTYFGDSVHPTQPLGASYVAQDFRYGLQGLLP